MILFEHALPNGQQAIVMELTYGRARIGTVNARLPQVFDDSW